jgi:prepilin-type N-terminal cleavage/methylation domain-containing protein
MNHRLFKKQTRAFTLVELLVVVTIIGILAALAFPAANLVIRSAKRAQASTMCNQIALACSAYNTEYGVYPIPAGGGGTGDYIEAGGTAVGDWRELTIALNGNRLPASPSTTQDTGLNRRNIPFLSPKKSDLDGNNAVVCPFRNGAAFYYYGIAMDADYNNYVEGIDPGGSGGTQTVNAGVAVWLPENTAVPATTPMLGTFSKE